MEQSHLDHVAKATDFVELKGRVNRLEEKYDDLVKVLDKLATKVDNLGLQIQKASFTIIGGAGVIAFLMSGALGHILSTFTAGGV